MRLAGTKYRDQQRQRAVWRARVATGEVRCARGAACRFAEGELWRGLDRGRRALGILGHADCREHGRSRASEFAIVPRRSG